MKATSTFALACLIVLLPGAIRAQQAQNLQVELLPTSPPVRLNRPMLTLWTLRSQIDPVVEGRLLLDLHDDQTVFSSHVIDDVVLTESPQNLTLLLPPLTVSNLLDEVAVRVRFETRGQVLELQPQVLRIPTSRQESLMTLVGEPPATGGRPRRRDLLIGRTQFENFGPEEAQGLYQTVVVSLRPQEFPQSALAYCQFDTVFLLADTLAMLRGPQLEALRQWVRAGGSVYVELPRLVETAQLNFLKSLADESPEPLVWQLTRQSQIDLDSLPANPLLSLRHGLGRVLLRISDGEPREDPLDNPEFLRGFAELWRLTPPHVAAVVDHGNWDPVLRGSRRPTSVQGSVGAPFGIGRPQSQEEAAGALGMHLGDYLAPRTLKLMPFWLIASMLSGLVIWIGPVEYLLLGRLRLRKWTWVTFPCAVLAMTWLTVWLANRAMSGVENGYSLQLLDYAIDGDLLRSQELSLHIPAASGTRTVDVDDGLFANVSTSSGGLSRYQRTTMIIRVGNRNVPRQVMIDSRTGQIVGGRPGFPQEFDGPRATAITGRVPRKYTVRQSVKQWTPLLTRSFSIPGRAPIANLDWSQVEVERHMTAEAFSRGFLPLELVASVRNVFGPAACVSAVLPRGVVLSDGRNDPLAEIAPPARDKFLRSAAHQQTVPAENWREFLAGSTVIRGETLRDFDGLRGGGILQDLTLIHPHSDHWVLVVAIPRGQSVEVHRKLCPLPESMLRRRAN